MTQQSIQTVAGAYLSRQNAFAILKGEKPGDKIQASKDFADSAVWITHHAKDISSPSFIENVRSIRSQAQNILDAFGSDDSIVGNLKPVVQEFNLRLS